MKPEKTRVVVEWDFGTTYHPIKLRQSETRAAWDLVGKALVIHRKGPCVLEGIYVELPKSFAEGFGMQMVGKRLALPSTTVRLPHHCYKGGTVTIEIGNRVMEMKFD